MKKAEDFEFSGSMERLNKKLEIEEPGKTVFYDGEDEPIRQFSKLAAEQIADEISELNKNHGEVA